MRAVIFNQPGSPTVGERRDPSVVEPTDAIVRVTHARVAVRVMRRGASS